MRLTPRQSELFAAAASRLDTLEDKLAAVAKEEPVAAGQRWSARLWLEALACTVEVDGAPAAEGWPLVAGRALERLDLSIDCTNIHAVRFISGSEAPVHDSAHL